MKNNLKAYLVVILIALSNNYLKGQETVDLMQYNIGDNGNKYFKDLNNYYTPFIGTWEYTNGNETFRVVLWKVARHQSITETNSFMDEMHGKFSMIQNAGLPNETIIYRSDKNLPNSTSPWPNVIQISGGIANEIGGAFIDNCILPTTDKTFIIGKLEINLNATSPLTANWKVIDLKGLRLSNYPNFRVPKDIVLTKVN